MKRCLINVVIRFSRVLDLVVGMLNGLGNGGVPCWLRTAVPFIARLSSSEIKEVTTDEWIFCLLRDSK